MGWTEGEGGEQGVGVGGGENDQNLDSDCKLIC